MLDLKNLEWIMKGLSSFNARDEVERIVDENKDVLTDLQRDQMMEGRSVDGDYIRPYYSENPYFKSAAAALKYAEWKQEITPNELRPLDVPNLYINGRFHNSLKTVMNGDEFSIESDDIKGASIFEEHKNAQGLDEDSRLKFATEITLPKFAEIFKEKTTLII
jgi:hypothetical protein